MLRVVVHERVAVRSNFNRPHDANMTREHEFTNQQFYPCLQGKPLLGPSLPDGTQVIRYIHNIGRTFLFRFSRGDDMAHIPHLLEVLIKAKWPKSADLLRGRKMIGDQNDMGFCLLHFEATVISSGFPESEKALKTQHSLQFWRTTAEKQSNVAD